MIHMEATKMVWFPQSKPMIKTFSQRVHEVVQMKKTSPLNALHPGEREPEKSTPRSGLPSKNNQKTHPAFNSITAIIKRVAAVFRIFSSSQRKPTTEDDDINRHTGGFSFSTDHSTGSNARNNGQFRSFSSYGSSDPRSGQLGMVIFSFEEIHKATGNFSPANKIGEGTFGTVYKGRLKDGSLLAVKRAKNKHDRSLSQEFKNEIYTLSKIEHLNLVRLFGFLEHKDEQIIVVEYVGNGDLREHLDGARGNGLEIAERLDIAIDVAHAITYLHMYTDPPIIHRDIKASNILITEKLRAKVADFGFARLAAEAPDATHISTQVKGSAGYVDPEYLRTYQLTVKSDVYSFGVLLVELVTGRYAIESGKPLKERVTIRWAMQKLKEQEVVIVMDPRLRRSPQSNITVEKILKLARQCLAPSRQSRPSMKTCAEVLWDIRKNFREQTLSASPSTSHPYADFPRKDTKKSRHALFGTRESDTHEFISA